MFKSLNNIGWIAAVFMALVPFVFYRPLFSAGVNSKYFFIVLFANFLALFVIKQIYSGKYQLSIKRRWFLFSLLAIIVVYYVSAFTGVFPERSLWSDLLRSSGVFFLTHVAFIGFVLGEFMTAKDWSLMRRSIAISAGFFSLLTFLGIEGLGWFDKFLWVDLNIHGLSFGNSTFAGAYLVLALTVALIELEYTKKNSKLGKTLLVSIALIIFSPALFNFGSFSDPISFLGNARASSATAWLLLIFLAGRYVLGRFVGLNSKVFVRIWTVVILSVVLIGNTLLFVPGSFVQDKYIESSTATRIIVWNSSIEAIKEQPLLGYGPENFELVFQKHFDNRLYRNENLKEIWFDRAHNVIVDMLVDIGVIGVLVILVFIGLFMSVVYKAKKRGLIGETEAIILAALPLVHVLQLQTSFDTVGTYMFIGVISGYGLWLERELVLEKTVKKVEPLKGRIPEKIFAAVLVVFVLLSLKFLVLDDYKRQVSLLSILGTRNNEQQEVYIEKSLSRVSSFTSLRFSSASFIKGVLEHLAINKGSAADTKTIVSRLSLYEDYYRAYLQEVPNHYRARMNYSYLLLLMTAFGEDRTKEVKDIISGSYDLSPGNPLTYTLDALASLYSGNVKEADQIMGVAVSLDPEISFTQEMVEYFDKQKKQFPNITILKLENL